MFTSIRIIQTAAYSKLFKLPCLGIVDRLGAAAGTCIWGWWRSHNKLGILSTLPCSVSALSEAQGGWSSIYFPLPWLILLLRLQSFGSRVGPSSIQEPECKYKHRYLKVSASPPQKEGKLRKYRDLHLLFQYFYFFLGGAEERLREPAHCSLWLSMPECQEI